jgi:hypothetical protein
LNTNRQQPAEAAHLSALLTVRHELKLEGLEPLHDADYTLVYEQQQRD